mgnify:FL=1
MQRGKINMWYTICVCYPIDLVDEGVGQPSETNEVELIGGPLDGLVLDFSGDEDVWTVPGMMPGMVPGLPSSKGVDWGLHVYARRRKSCDKMYHVGVTKKRAA